MLRDSVIVTVVIAAFVRTCPRTIRTAGYDNHEKINSWISFSFRMSIGLRLVAPELRKAGTTRRREIFKRTSKGRFTRYDFDACDNFMTGLRYD